ncbi:Vacuolar protein sorting/targeting protein 10 [Erysiphe neolycopersici]|uniref:Vacuolar protein sorting/targeting protein 10 n=1 Tax=Erysiphe neolycopersici TaxID=212602 RepID=A0A420I447_9PEZI|nr:Vacuolar protein sorting/targeting protein 10 [Erysiphe neolycopersici]
MRPDATCIWRHFMLPLLLLSSSFSTTFGRNEKPRLQINKFDFMPYNVNYFDKSDIILFIDPLTNDLYRSSNAGETWSIPKDIPRGTAISLIMHPWEPSRAYIITEDRLHWMTYNRGESWRRFEVERFPSLYRDALTFHAGDPDRIIWNGMDCSGIFCDEITMYTTDNFKHSKFLRDDTDGCHWAKSTKEFTTGDKFLDQNRIVCVARGRFSPWRTDFRLLISDNFFYDAREIEPELEAGRTVKGIINMASVTKYLIAAATSDRTDEMSLYVSDDSINWHKAVFPHDHKLRQESYTVLEGTNYSIQIDIQSSGRPMKPMGVFLTSNSNGTYFVRNIEHTNRNEWGIVDFEKVTGIQGIVIVNTVKNFEQVENLDEEKQIQSKISFDDGRDFTDLSCDGHPLHLHSVTDISNSGRIFSSPAPGLVMGIGNTGNYLKHYLEGSLYVSDDAGVSWTLALDGAYKYEFGDQGTILVAVKEGITDELKYSLNHGKDWQSVAFPDGLKIRPIMLTTTRDSSTLKFLLEGLEEKQPASFSYIIAIDFDDMHEGKCNESDMEKWYARVNEKREPTCLMGHKQYFMRRKKDANCFVKSEFKGFNPNFETCECTDADFECDYNFVRSADRKSCELAGTLALPEGACKAFGPDDTFKGSSGWRLIPGNDCKRKPGSQKDDLVDRKCSEALGKPTNGKISTTSNEIPGTAPKNQVYLERSSTSSGIDETILIRSENSVWITHDHGKVWNQILEGESISLILPHPHFTDMVYFLTPTRTVFYSTERGKNIRKFEAPYPPNAEGRMIMNFHPKQKDWIIWLGGKDCDSQASCHTVASVTTHRGEDWTTIQRYVQKCEFVKEFENRLLAKPPSSEEIKKREKLIHCQVRQQERKDSRNNPWLLKSSDDFFNEGGQVHYSSVVDFATMSEFTIVATKDEDKNTMSAHASIDGYHFADARFPHGFVVDHQHGYTVLDSSTHSAFLHVTVNNEPGLEYGTIIKSNSNGTFYFLTLSSVNRDTTGYVDFEKMIGIEGVAVVNVVTNAKDKDYAKQGKKLKTMITHNDGGEWIYLTPPTLDANKKKFSCGGNLEKCSLNIHGYTERQDKSHTYSSASAAGLMLATGNVGEFLSKDADTFMTNDAGVTWKSVMKGRYLWEFGDQGSLIVIVSEDRPTKSLYYSTDEGETWTEFEFSNQEVSIINLSTVPSDNSRNFIIWAKTRDQNFNAINIDFSGLTDVQCKLDEQNLEKSDYRLWTPKHPTQGNDCLFGHVSQYYRKISGANCYNGKMIPRLHNIARNCSCARQDYECDFNYQRQTDGTCALVPGFNLPDHSLVCAVEGTVEYSEPTGYRKIPGDTCTTNGGPGMDESNLHACPGMEEEFKKKHATSSIGIFFAIIIPFVAASMIGYWVWKNWTRKFGQIRLGESSFDNEASYVRYPVLIIAGVVAAVQATPLLISSLWHSITTTLGINRSMRFTTRDSFARGQSEYAIVDEDEGELLGEDSDDEV